MKRQHYHIGHGIWIQFISTGVNVYFYIYFSIQIPSPAFFIVSSGMISTLQMYKYKKNLSVQKVKKMDKEQVRNRWLIIAISFFAGIGLMSIFNIIKTIYNQHPIQYDWIMLAVSIIIISICLLFLTIFKKTKLPYQRLLEK